MLKNGIIKAAHTWRGVKCAKIKNLNSPNGHSRGEPSEITTLMIEKEMPVQIGMATGEG